jgi:threonine aldolase
VSVRTIQLCAASTDNYSGIHPEVLAAIVEANDGHQIAYGEDQYTERLQEVFRQHFGEGVEAFPSSTAPAPT